MKLAKWRKYFLAPFFFVIFYLFNFFVLLGLLTQFLIFLPFNFLFIFFLILKKARIRFKENFGLVKIISNLFLIASKFFFSVLKRFILIFNFLFSLVFVSLIKARQFFFEIIVFFKFLIHTFFFFLKRFFQIGLQKFKFLGGIFSFKVRYFFFGVLVTSFLFILIQGYLFIKSLPSPTYIGQVNYSLTSYIYDRNGRTLFEIFKDQSRTPIKLNNLPKYVIQATIAIEDKDFYKHNGVSFVSGILRAIRDSFYYQNLQGGSTITQQLIKSSLLTPEKKISRKIKEIILALWAERIFSKDEILEMYLNQIPYGGTAYGIEEAAKFYFGKTAAELTLNEAALLAGLPNAPSYYSPHTNPQRALNRRNEVLKAMKDQGYISNSVYLHEVRKPLGIKPFIYQINAPHFVFFVKNYLEDIYGVKKVESGGLRVTTTLDLEIQKEAEKILFEEIEKIKKLNVTNGAILVTNPRTGEILAMVGSVDYFASPSGAFNVVLGFRQPGSAIKPLLYGYALSTKKITAASIIDDSPTTFKLPGGINYKPVNYDNRFHGRVPVRYALANSYNVPAVKILASVGLENFLDFCQKVGITNWRDPKNFGLSLALGGGELRMIDLVEAYGLFANEGKKVNLSSIIEIRDSFGKKIFENKPLVRQLIDNRISFIVSDILSDNFARKWAFGQNSALEIPGYKVAVKTGTTDDKKDNWTIGYTPEFLVAVWVGNNDNQPMNQNLVSGVTGAAPIWNRLMSYLLKTKGKGIWFKKPDGLIERKCFFGRNEFFIPGTEKLTNCGGQILEISPTLHQ